ncbi:MAG: hypothetical protein ABEJ89_10250 [Haloarculaceae archaeon]
MFGDRTGLVLWLALVLALALCWRVGFYITDTHAVANTLVNVAQGHLAVTHLRYPLDTIGTTHTQPGLYIYGGSVYGRNYGQVAAALPVLWALQVLSAVAAPRLVLAGAWCLGLLAWTDQLEALSDGRWPVREAGAVGSIAVFVGSLALARPLDPRLLPLVALQVTTLFAAAGVGVVLYRLVEGFHGVRAGVAAGLATGLATPVGFWATFPKRHVLVACLALAGVLSFAVSRRRGSLRHRALAYGLLGLIAWVHAFEGFFLVATLGLVDLATASTGRRALLVIGAVLFVALLPTFATDVAITGNPLQAPRLMPAAHTDRVGLSPAGNVELVGDGDRRISTGGSGVDLSEPGGGSGGGSSGSSGAGSSGGGSSGGAPTGGGIGLVGWIVGSLTGGIGFLIGLLPQPPDTVLVVTGFVTTTLTKGFERLLDPGVLEHVFLRSGRIPGVRYAINAHETIELTVLESAPLLGALLALPVLVGVHLRRVGRSVLAWPRSLPPRRQTDLLVTAMALVFTVVYLPRLPLVSQLTTRYILLVYPLALYGVARLGPVRGAIDGATRWLAVTYAVTTAGWLVGGLVLVAALGLAVGEAMQLQALVSLAGAGVLAVTVAGRAVAPRRVPDRWVAVALGTVAGLTTAFLFASALSYFPYGGYAFDLVRVVAGAVPSL